VNTVPDSDDDILDARKCPSWKSVANPNAQQPCRPFIKSLLTVRRLSLPVNIIRTVIACMAVFLTAWTQWFAAPDASFLGNERLRDHFIQIRASTAPESRIAVIDIDEASLAALGPWPWPRERLADMTENLLVAYGAQGVALDMVLPERADTEGDARMAMLAQSGKLVLAQTFDYATRTLPLKVGRIAGGKALDGKISAVAAGGYIGNHMGLSQAKLLGNIGVLPDSDGMIRRLPLYTQYAGLHYPTLALALFESADGNIAPPASGSALWRIPYSRDWSSYTVISAHDVLELRVPHDLVRNRFVLVGSSSLGLSDRVATPLATSTPGVLIHASTLSTLMDAHTGLTPAPWPGQAIALLFSILVVVSAAYTFPRLSALANVSLLLGTSLVWLILAFWISEHDAMLSTTGPLATNLFLLAVAVPFDWHLSQRRARYLLGTLHQYVAKSIVDELLRSDLKNPLAPRQCNVTTLVADMEGYTGHVESLSIEAAAQLTRDFLNCLTHAVIEKCGTLDKYTGDGLVAFWGAPLPNDDHADLALDAAQEIVERVQEFSRERQRQGLSKVRVRIGIESGVAVAGDFGTALRSGYTAVGDSVNIASRLEDVGRNLPHDIIIGQGTVSLSKRHQFTCLGDVLLRGKENPTTIYSLQS
jgi:adenylate cyclase